MMREPRSTANRTVLAVTGLALALGGLWLATARTSFAAHLPGGWPVPFAGSVLLDREGLATLRGHDWWTPAVLAAGVSATLLLALWLLSQLHVRNRSRLPLAAPGSALRTHALECAVSERAAAIDGVARCRVRIHTRRRRLRLRIHTWLAPDTAPEAVLDALTAVTAELERATAPYTVETRVRLSHRTHRMQHVR